MKPVRTSLCLQQGPPREPGVTLQRPSTCAGWYGSPQPHVATEHLTLASETDRRSFSLIPFYLDMRKQSTRP